MTPPATTTPDARSTKPKRARRNRKDAAAAHQRAIRQQPGTRAPRRVSGPIRGRAHEVAVPRPSRRPRVSPAPRRRAGERSRGLPSRILAFIGSLPDHALLDRVIRGRAWIPLLGLMLAGIVAMQVEVLKLGASIGRSIQRGGALQSRNELLRASVASLADDQRIERLAAGMGMVMPAPSAVGFLEARGGAAIPKIQPPNSTAFAASLAALAAAAQQSQPPTSSPTTTSTTTTSTSTTTGTAAASAVAQTASPTPSSAASPVQAVPPTSSGVSSSATSATSGG